MLIFHKRRSTLRDVVQAITEGKKQGQDQEVLESGSQTRENSGRLCSFAM